MRTVFIHNVLVSIYIVSFFNVIGNVYLYLLVWRAFDELYSGMWLVSVSF
ncbi:hypothetical protein RchiOBHm_Chr5g0077641 [Rosa chinensis]|uniref:Uncharacterized protein n=1 Tax=Rosa chinensis TaxID=74649 RepID=A0A2P6QM08_ROSCH|nr:hypothetical protein RchiOBHm_Chr5g0077641 [Rosa chinensis]